MKQELIEHLNNVEQLVKRNYTVLEVMKNVYENNNNDIEDSQKILEILRELIKKQQEVLNGLQNFISISKQM